MKTVKTIFTAILVVLFSSTFFAQGDIISAADFMKLTKSDKNLVIIDASKAETYKKMHVKNAVNVPSGALTIEGNDIDGILKSPEDLATLFGDAGVSETNTIVVYDGGSQKYSSRVYWTLKYLGAPNVKILHKDMDLWKKSRVPITKMPTSSKKTTFTPNLDNAIYANINEVKAGDAMIVDCRTVEEFNGTADNSDGHLPGAVNIDYKELLTDTEAFKSKEEMEKVMAKYGITSSTKIVSYCRTSVRATVLYAALVNVLGYNNVKVYDGAYLEWVAMGNKIETKAGVSVKKSSGGSGGGC
jgi:thiosulfate/3-mercaptopyruvate sulfurtransferase